MMALNLATKRKGCRNSIKVDYQVALCHILLNVSAFAGTRRAANDCDFALFEKLLCWFSVYFHFLDSRVATIAE